MVVAEVSVGDARVLQPPARLAEVLLELLPELAPRFVAVLADIVGPFLTLVPAVLPIVREIGAPLLAVVGAIGAVVLAVVEPIAPVVGDVVAAVEPVVHPVFATVRGEVAIGPGVANVIPAILPVIEAVSAVLLDLIEGVATLLAVPQRPRGTAILRRHLEEVPQIMCGGTCTATGQVRLCSAAQSPRTGTRPSGSGTHASRPAGSRTLHAGPTCRGTSPARIRDAGQAR